MGWQEAPESLVGFVDSDFAACPRTRKSTAGGCIKWCQYMIKSRAKTLPFLALSSGEAELVAVVRGAMELKRCPIFDVRVWCGIDGRDAQ